MNSEFSDQKTSSTVDGLTIAIDASRNRSGGARAHLLGLLSSFDPREIGIASVHVWSYSKLLDELPERPWLIKHSPADLELSVFRQLWWQFRHLPAEIQSAGCDALLNTGASTVCTFKPSITMSRDMLSFEKGEMQRYPLLSRSRLRLLAIKYIQIYALRKADGVIFLTRYAASTIQRFTGKLTNTRVVPHGISENFRQLPNPGYWHGARKEIHCVYISNTDLYKHQWHVVNAISRLRADGIPISLTLIGGGIGPGKKLLDQALTQHDPSKEFVRVVDAVSHRDIPLYLADTDIFIFASSCENMPNTLVEAMASSLPIACSDRGPMPEVLENSGAYFNPEDVNSISTAIRKIINDAPLRYSFSKNSSLLAKKYSWSRCARETFEYLIEISKKQKK